MNKSLLYCFFYACLSAGLFNPAEIFAHHGVEGGTGGGGLIHPSGSVGMRQNQAGFRVTHVKGEERNRDRTTTEALIEAVFLDGALSIFGTVPGNYYHQYDRKDAFRTGRPVIGTTIYPFQAALEPGYLAIDSSIGFPAGNDSDLFVEEDYWDARGGLSAGVGVGPWFGSIRLGGRTPLSKLKGRYREDAGHPYYLQQDFSARRSNPDQYYPERDEPRLRNVTELSGYTGVSLLESLSLYVGALYRNPYRGIYHEPVERNPLFAYLLAREPLNPMLWLLDRELYPADPHIYYEAMAGVAANIGESIGLNVAWSYPLERGRRSLFDSSLSVMLTARFGRFHLHGD